MTRLLVLCAAVLAFAGFTSGSNFKNELLDKLKLNEDRLGVAIQNAQSHGFGYSVGVYKDLLKQVQDQRKVIKALSDDLKQGEAPNEVSALVKLDSTIFVRIAQISNSGTTKINAIYLAAMKTLTGHGGDKINPKKLKDQVAGLIDFETYEALNPGAKTSDRQPRTFAEQILYILHILKTEIDGWLVPSFDDFYRVANRTRDSIARSRELKMTKEADKMTEELTQFDSLTLDLANLFPLNKKDAVETYFNVSQSHYALYVRLVGVKPYEKTIKEELLDLLYRSEVTVHTAMVHFRQVVNSHFENRLNVTRQEIVELSEEVKKLPELVDRSETLELMKKVQSLQVIAEAVAANPAPDESLKVQATYLAAIKNVQNDTDNSPITAEMLHEQLRKIITAENLLIKPEMPLKEQILRLSMSSELKTLYNELQNLIVSHKIPTPKDHEDLAERAKTKLLKLYAERRIDSASKMSLDHANFVQHSRDLNQLLPMRSEYVMDKWFGVAVRHYKLALKLETYLKDDFPPKF